MDFSLSTSPLFVNVMICIYIYMYIHIYCNYQRYIIYASLRGPTAIDEIFQMLASVNSSSAHLQHCSRMLQT